MRETTDSERTCIVTRRRAPPEAMIRFVRAPDGALAPDIRAKLPGRGVWVTACAERVAEAARKGMFSRSLKAEVVASPRLAEDVDRLLERDCLQMLALANKAGLATTGFAKVAAALEKGAVAVLAEATDGGADGRRKLAQIVRRAAAGGAPAPQTVALFTSAQLDLALGRTNVIHAALATGGPAAAFAARCRRLADYRGTTLDKASGVDAGGEEAPAPASDLRRAGPKGPGSGTG